MQPGDRGLKGSQEAQATPKEGVTFTGKGHKIQSTKIPVGPISTIGLRGSHTGDWPDAL